MNLHTTYDTSKTNRKNVFVSICARDKLNIAKWLYSLGLGSEHETNRIFSQALRNTNLKNKSMMIWLCNTNNFALVANFYRIPDDIIDCLRFPKKTIDTMKYLRNNDELSILNDDDKIDNIIIHILCYHNKLGIINSICEKLTNLNFVISKKKRILKYNIGDIEYNKNTGYYTITESENITLNNTLNDTLNKIIRDTVNLYYYSPGYKIQDLSQDMMNDMLNKYIEQHTLNDRLNI